MGLNVSHDCWSGAYSSFNRWRDALAEVAGYTLHGFGVDLDWGNVEATIGEDLLGRWPAVPVRPDGTPDPLIILLAHSDCEGEIQAEFVAPLADRLEALLPLMEFEPTVAVTERFIAGLRYAAAGGEAVVFR